MAASANRMINRIRIQNFKSIHDVTVDLSPVTVLVGRSGTGKSNFVEAIRFLRNIVSSPKSTRELQRDWNGIRPATAAVDSLTQFDIEFSIAGIEDTFVYGLTIGTAGPQVPPEDERLSLGDTLLFHQRTGDRFAPDWVVKPSLIEIPDAGSIAIGRLPAISEVVIAYTALSNGIGCYAFPDAVLTSAGHNGANVGLDDNAQNYLDTLKEIARNLQDLNVRKNLLAALQRVNPSISSLELDDIQNPQAVIVGHRFGEKTLALQLPQESDGFRRFYAHLLALYQRPPKQTLIFEHPEDGIHPGALSLLAEEFKSAPADGRGQVILTTHSPKLLDHFEADQIRVVEIEGLETRIGPMSCEQYQAIQDNLLDPGELLTVDPARLSNQKAESAAT